MEHRIIKLEFCFFFRTFEPGEEDIVHQEVQSPSEGSTFWQQKAKYTVYM